MQLSLAQIEQATGARLTGAGLETAGLETVGSKPITGWSIDSRSVQSGDVFFAIPGERFDGHAYVQEALNSGAAAVVVSQEVEYITWTCIDGRQLGKSIRKNSEFWPAHLG